MNEPECPHGAHCCQNEPCTGPSDPEMQGKRIELVQRWVKRIATGYAAAEEDADNLLEQLDALTFGGRERECREFLAGVASGDKSKDLPISIRALLQRLDSELISDRACHGLESSITLNQQERSSLHHFLRAADNYYRAIEGLSAAYPGPKPPAASEPSERENFLKNELQEARTALGGLISERIGDAVGRVLSERDQLRAELATVQASRATDQAAFRESCDQLRAHNVELEAAINRSHAERDAMQAEHLEMFERLRAELDKAKVEVKEHRDKWWGYEQSYILPCFTWAKELGLDLEALVRETPGKNCVELFVGWLRESWRLIPPHDLVLHCPNCGKQHLDIGEFATRVHRKHKCENTPEGPGTGCGHEWKPFEYATRGVMIDYVLHLEKELERESGRKDTWAEDAASAEKDVARLTKELQAERERAAKLTRLLENIRDLRSDHLRRSFPALHQAIVEALVPPDPKTPESAKAPLFVKGAEAVSDALRSQRQLEHLNAADAATARGQTGVALSEVVAYLREERRHAR